MKSCYISSVFTIFPLTFRHNLYNQSSTITPSFLSSMSFSWKSLGARALTLVFFTNLLLSAALPAQAAKPTEPPAATRNSVEEKEKPNECKNYPKHLEQYGSYDAMPAGLQRVYADCASGEGRSSASPAPSNKQKEEKSAASPSSQTKDSSSCSEKTYQQLLNAFGSYEDFPPALQEKYKSCTPLGTTGEAKSPNENANPNALPPTLDDTPDCSWVDDKGRPRTQWHKDMVEGKPMNLFKVCKAEASSDPNTKTYSPQNPHPGCKGITNAYEGQQERGKATEAPGLRTNYLNCQSYGTPYLPKESTTLPSIDDPSLTASGSIVINDDNTFTHTENVALNLSPETTPAAMRFSADGNTWTDWESFADTRDFLLTETTADQKATVFVQYQTGSTTSEPESDSILLLPKYNASYTVQETYGDMSLQANMTHALTVTIKNTGALTWDSEDPSFPVVLRYRLLESNGNPIQTEDPGNSAFFSTPIAYGEKETVLLPVRIPDLPSGDYQLQIDLQEHGVTWFSEMGVTPKTIPLSIMAKEATPRPVIENPEDLSFGVGGIAGYVPLEDEPAPEVVTVCQPSENLYTLNETEDSFLIAYSVPYGRSIHNVQDVWVDTNDNTAFYELSYSEYVNDQSTYYLYRDSGVESELCPEEQDQFQSARACENLYPDVGHLSGMLCLDLAKATANKWVSGYVEDPYAGYFLPDASITRAEFAKVIVHSLNLPLLPHPDATVFADVDPNDGSWYDDYLYTAYSYGILSPFAEQMMLPDAPVSFEHAVDMSMRMFSYQVDNPCHYEILYPENKTIGAALFYGVIEQNAIPTDIQTPVTRAYLVHMMVNAEAQQQNFSSTTLACPQSADDTYTIPNDERLVCASETPAFLYETPDAVGASLVDAQSELQFAPTLIPNQTRVEILTDAWESKSSTAPLQVNVLATGDTGYLEKSLLAESCSLPTPALPLQEPEPNQAVVATPVGIYAHTFPSILTPYTDVNGDFQNTAADILPYNSILTVLEAKDDWLLVSFTETDGEEKQGWVHTAFLSLGTDVPLPTRTPLQTATLDWAHGMTVDLRSTPTSLLSNIVWEGYEGISFHILEDNPNSPYVQVRIDTTTKNLSTTTLDQMYGRLYDPDLLATLAEDQRGLSGYIHRDFLRYANTDYPTPLTLPYDATLLPAEDQYINQIFLEEFMGLPLHNGLDIGLPLNTELFPVADGIVVQATDKSPGEEKGLGKTITVYHPEQKLYSHYAHLNTMNVIPGDTVTTDTIIGLSGGEEDMGSGKGHLHLMLTETEMLPTDPKDFLNPTKYLADYNADQGHPCVRELILGEMLRDGAEIAERCEVGVGGEEKLCQASKELTISGLNEADYGSTTFTYQEGENLFGDVSAESEICAEETRYLEEALQRGIISPKKANSDWNFYPKGEEGLVSRAEAVKMLIEAAYPEEFDTRREEEDFDHLCFSDIPEGAWYADYICFAKEKGILTGYDDGTFRPENSIGRPEMTKIALTAFGFVPDCFQESEEEKNASSYPRDQWYSPYFGAALRYDILSTEQANVPTAQTTREEALLTILRAEEHREDFQNMCPEYMYSLVAQHPMYLVPFFEEDGNKEVVFRIKNTGSKTWNKDDVAIANEEGTPVLSLDQTVAPGEEWKGTFSIQRPTFGESQKKTYHLVYQGTKDPIQGPDLSWMLSYEEKRNFKTSTDETRIYHEPNLQRPLEQSITPFKEPILVVGRAVEGEYVDSYKTDRWYPVWYEPWGVAGYVPATLVHAEKLGDVEIDFNILTNECYNSSPQNIKKEGIILHFTVSNNTLESERSTMNNCANTRSVQYIIDREGNIMQLVRDYDMAWHANPDNSRSVGIEIINWGVAKEKDGKWYNYNETKEIMRVKKEDIDRLLEEGLTEEQKNSIWKVDSQQNNFYTFLHKDKDTLENSDIFSKLENTFQEEVLRLWDSSYNEIIDVSEDYPIIWEIWKLEENHNEQISYGGKEEYWQNYTDQQYTALNELLPYLEERLAIQHQSFDYPIPGKENKCDKYGFYFAPDRRSAVEEWDKYKEKRQSFNGIYGHHNVTAKYDPGPHMNILRLNLISEEDVKNCAF